MTLDLANLRYRAASKMTLCTREHEVHRTDDGQQVWMTCDGKELDRLELPKTSGDFSQDIRVFVYATMIDHERDVVSAVVIELLDRLEQAR